MSKIWKRVKVFFTNLIRSFRTSKIRFVDEKDAEKLLDSIGELDKLKSGHISCCSCGKTITIENFSSFYREGEQYYFICDDYKCFSKFTSQ